MPNVNLTDSRSRDAVVKAETTGISEDVRYVDEAGQSAYTRKILKATVEHDFETLVKHHEGDAESLGKALVESDPEVDMEICGLYLWGVSKVYVDSSDGIVYRIEQQEIVRGPDGTVREKRPRNQPEANVDSEIPLTWTGRKVDKDEAVRRFVFASKLQIVHVNGLTYDFLYGMAKELAESNSLMMVGGGSKGRDPLVFRRGSVPYRGFLEGRIDGDKYLLMLHLSNMELKVPSADKSEAAEEKSESATNKKKAAEKPAVKDNAEVDKEKAEKVKESTVEEIAKKPEPKAKPEKKSAKKSSKKPPVSATEEETAEQKDTRLAEDKAEKATTEPVAKDKASKASEPLAEVTNEDLGIWLKSIRMGKYLKLFIEHEIDIDVMTELTDDDLKELDIPLGSRRRLLKAVEETDNLHADVASAVKQMPGTGKKSAGQADQKSKKAAK